MRSNSILILLILATLSSGAAAALFHWRMRQYRRLYRAMQRREGHHLAAIWRLQQPAETKER